MLPLPLREEPSTRSEVDGKTIASLSYMEIYNDKATSTAASGLHCQHTSDFVLCRFDCRLLLAPCCACVSLTLRPTAFRAFCSPSPCLLSRSGTYCILNPANNMRQASVCCLAGQDLSSLFTQSYASEGTRCAERVRASEGSRGFCLKQGSYSRSLVQSAGGRLRHRPHPQRGV